MFKAELTDGGVRCGGGGAHDGNDGVCNGGVKEQGSSCEEVGRKAGQGPPGPYLDISKIPTTPLSCLSCLYLADIAQDFYKSYISPLFGQ